MKKYLYIEEDGETKAEALVVSGSGSGYIFITNITSSGNVGDLVYVADTVPTSTVIESCTIDEADATVYFLAEGGLFYSPVVSIGATECTNLTQVAGDKRLFEGSITTNVATSSEIQVDIDGDQYTTVQINRAPGPPIITDVRFVNGYPGSQTEVKDNDDVDIQLTFDMAESEPATVTISSGGVCDAQVITLVGYDHGVGTAVVSGNVANPTTTPTAKSITFTTKNAIGSESDAVNSLDNGDLGDGISTLICSDLAPSFINNGTTFPAAQTAFKGTETGSQDVTVANYTSILYSSPGGDFNITSTTTYAQDKGITCTNPGDYNDSSNNYRIQANRAANNTVAYFNTQIEVADTAPVVTISQQYTRLRSSAAGRNSTITATANQNITTNPDITIPVSGSWGGSMSGGPKVYTRTIVTTDGDTVGTAAWTFNTLPVNKAGTSASISGDQVVGGFVARDLTLEAFANEISVDVEVTNYSKLNILTWSYTDADLTRATTINTSPPVPNEFTIDAISTDPHTFRILDTNKTNSSSQATIIYGYEEQI